MQPSRFAVELRAEVSGNRVVGHASVFDQYASMPGHLEMMARSAFDAVLANQGTDVLALFNHDPNMVLGRQSAQTLRLNVDREGLAFDVDLPNTSYANDLRESLARGDIKGASFAFIPGEDDWSITRDGRQVRTHTSVARLLDVSVVSFPAYEGAGVMLRSLTDIPITAIPAQSRRDQLIRVRTRVLSQKESKTN